ncbi:MAG: RecT family recombinase [Sulfuricellaceae bacterium]|nr:RecT family recombinase [Sulfuricellaceae bacterium]
MSTELANYETQSDSGRASSLAIITNDGSMTRLLSLAKLMASSKVTVPKHLQGSEGDCMAIAIQAANWGMNPFAVAQKTHLVNGVLGYEAQLVNAVISASGAIVGGFEYEYKDDGGLQCRVGAMVRGKAEITWGEWLAEKSVTTKNSPLWKTNPRQQLGYLQVKNWARLYAPGAILGIYTTDELQTAPQEIEINPRQNPAPAEASKPAIYSDVDFEKNFGKWADMIREGKKTADQIISIVQAKAQLTEAQKASIRAVKAGPPAIGQISFAQVADALYKAQELDTLDVAADLIGEVADPAQREELGQIYNNQRALFQEAA